MRPHPRRASDRKPRSLVQRGAALVEMAILLPVLIICFWGVVEIGQYLMMSERLAKTANQLSAVLYTLRPSDLQSGGTANTVIEAAIKNAQTLPRPWRATSIAVRYCQRRAGGTGALEQIYLGKTVPSLPGCDTGPACKDGLITQEGYGAYVQAYACQQFNPAITPRYFKRFMTTGGAGLKVEQIAFIPLTDTNQTALIKKAGSLDVPSETGGPVGPPPPGAGCGGPGQPACVTPTTCGGAGQPACPPPPPPCGGAGQPVCPPTCTGQLMPSGICLQPLNPPPTTPVPAPPPTPPVNPNPPVCPPGYISGNGGAYCYVNPSCDPNDPLCTSPCTAPAQLINGGCQRPNNCTGGQIIDTTTGTCASNCNNAAGNCPNGRNQANCSCLPACTAPAVPVNGACQVPCGYGQIADGSGGCKAFCDTGFFNQGTCDLICPTGTIASGSVCMAECNQNQFLGPNNICVDR